MGMRIGTRGSMLALVQARLVLAWLGEGEIVVVPTPHEAPTTEGEEHDAGYTGQAGAKAAPQTPKAGDKSRWVEDLERALLNGEVDLAVHSAKDVPGELAGGLELIGSPVRAAAEDVLVGAGSLDDLPRDGYVGTSSVRRGAQLRSLRSDLHVVSLRGNVDTRLRKLANRTIQARSKQPSGASRGPADGEPVGGATTSHDDPAAPSAAARRNPPLDAIVLAHAGLARLGRERDVGCVLPAASFVPAPGQGLLAIQARGGDMAARAAVETIIDRDASVCLKAERAVARALDASCNTPLGAHATATEGGGLHLRAWVGLPDGSQWLADELLGGSHEPEELGRRVAQRLEAVGARELLQRAQEAAVEGP